MDQSHEVIAEKRLSSKTVAILLGLAAAALVCLFISVYALSEMNTYTRQSRQTNPESYPQP